MGELFERLCLGGGRKDHYKEIVDWKKTYPDQKLYIWGVGSVANGVIHELEKRGIKVGGCFVNVPDYHIDLRVKRRNLSVFQLDELLCKNVAFSVIIGHSHYELANLLEQYPQVRNVWSLNNVARDDADITEEFLKENIGFFEETYTRFEDEASRKNMTAYLNAQLTKDDTWILSCFEKPSTYFENDVITLKKHEVYLDLGAYNGDSIEKFIESCRDFKQVLAVEVQPDMCRTLVQKWGKDERIKIYNTGISSYKGEACFYFDDQSTCIVNKNAEGILTPVTTVDMLCADFPGISLIKICIGNTIIPILEGARRTIEENVPKIVIAAGIDKRALIDYIPKIEELAGTGRYQYYLRFTNAMEECLVLYAIPKEETGWNK